MNLSPFLRVLLFSACLACASCQTATPEKCFDLAVLNSNLLVGFAGEGLWRELESPSVKMGKTKDELLPMQRGEVLGQKIKFIEENYEKVQDLKQTDDNKGIIQASLALYQHILPVYKNEYTELARLFDSGAPREGAEKLDRAIREKHRAKFEALYAQLISSGKLYAAQHNIPVNWAM